MDYIREELQRQRLLLTALLTGQTVATPPEEPQTADQAFWTEAGDLPLWELRGSAGAVAAVDLPWRGMANQATGAYLSALGENAPAGEAAALRTALEALAASKRGTLAGRAGESGLKTAMFSDPQYGTTVLGRMAENGTTAPKAHGAEAGETAWVSHGTERAGFRFFRSGGVGEAAAAWAPASAPESAEDGAIQLVAELRRTEGGGLSDPAALSRAFQRDARRYDGGFRLY